MPIYPNSSSESSLSMLRDSEKTMEKNNMKNYNINAGK